MIDLENLVIKHGKHDYRDEGMCALEAVAYIAGEPHSDHPNCASPSIAAFLRSWNDNLGEGGAGDEARTRLIKPLLALVVGTVGSDALETRRGYRIVDPFVMFAEARRGLVWS